MIALANYLEQYVSVSDLAGWECLIVAVVTVMVAGAILRSKYSNSYWE